MKNEGKNIVRLQYPDGKPMAQVEHILRDSHIFLKGDGNAVWLCFATEQQARDVLQSPGFSLQITGNGNQVFLDRISVGYLPQKGINGLLICIGGGPDDWIDGTEPRTADRCFLSIGCHTKINGAYFLLQDSGSRVRVGEDTMMSWGIDVWCTDVHTLLDRNGRCYNKGRFIDIGSHVWVGKDVKIGKNTRIADGCVVGWGSIVTKQFVEPHCLLAGVPAKVVKKSIDWDGRCINNYEAHGPSYGGNTVQETA